MTDRDLDRDALLAEFDETPIDSPGVCPLHLEGAIFPVRYAIDEAASEPDEIQGPHPLVDGWNDDHGYPTLQTRSYTLRQLRDGWLYVWDEVDTTFHEYRIDGHLFTRLIWPENINDVRPDVRGGEEGESRSCLIYPCRSTIWLAYSPVQWTWRICEHLRSNEDSRQRFMRRLNVRTAVEAPGNVAHVGPMTELGQRVADITPEGSIDDFASTTVMTRALTEEEQEGDAESVYTTLDSKPEISQNAVLAQVPRKDEAIFVALDDDLGIVNDLTMQLLGAEAASEMFNDEHGHRLESAQMVQRLCGVSVADLPDTVPDDPESQRRAIDLINRYCEREDFHRAMNRGSPFENPPVREGTSYVGPIEAGLEELGIDPERDIDLEAWRDRSLWRSDVHYQEALAYIEEHQPEIESLQLSRQQCREDLIVWLERLPLSAQELCFDSCNPIQTQALIEFTHQITQALGASETGQQWLTTRALERDHLIGLAMFNFTPELEQAFIAAARDFLAQDLEGEVTISDATNVASRGAEANNVLDLEIVRNHPAFKALADASKQSLEVFINVVAQPARIAWESIAFQLLPAAGAGVNVTAERLARSLSQVMSLAFVHPENAATGAQFVKNPNYEAEYARWDSTRLRIENSLNGEINSLRERTDAQTRRGQHTAIRKLEEKLKNHTTHIPKLYRYSAPSANSQGKSPGETLGYDKLRQQYRIRLEQGAAVAKRHAQHWMSRYGVGLSILVAGLNLLNMGATALKIDREGMSDNNAKSLLSGLGYTGQAVLSLWVTPYWNKHATRTATFFDSTKTLAGAGVRKWNIAGNVAFARTAAKLTTRVATMAVFGVLGAGMESWQIYGQLDSATSTTESIALYTKGISTLGMGAISALQLSGALLGKTVYAFAWVMASWITISLFIFGAIYLISSMVISRFHREGVRLWLYQSTWGYSPRWEQTDEGHAAEWRNLMETLSQPSVEVKEVTGFDYERVGAIRDYDNRDQNSWEAMANKYRGYWLAITFPPLLAGVEVTLSGNASRGFWATPHELVHRTEVPINDLPAAVDYATDDSRVWVAWLPEEDQPQQSPLTLWVNYPPEIVDSPADATFVFQKDQDSDGGRKLEPADDAAQVALATDNGITLSIP